MSSTGDRVPLVNRRTRRLLIAAAILAIGAVGLFAAVLWAGWVGEVVLESEPREPTERLLLAPARAGLLDSSGRTCPGEDPKGSESLDSWRAWLKSLSWPSTTIAVEGIRGGVGALSLVIAPRASCLSVAEAAALRTYVHGGGGLLAVGPLGVRDERGREVGFGLLEELLGAEHFEALPDGETAFVALREGSPLAAGLTALRLDPPSKGRVLAVATGLHPYWSDPRFQPLDPSLPQSYQSAALTASFGAGRVAWLGFDPDPGGVTGARGPRLLRNAGSWAAAQPLVSLAPWPSPYLSAVLLRANLAGRPRNASFVVEALADAQTKAAFVVRDDSLEDLEGLEPPLSRAGEVAIFAHAGPEPSPGPFSRLQVELRRLRVRSSLGAWPTGILQGTGSDEQAARACATAGLEFYLTDGPSDRAVPAVRRATWRFGPLEQRLDLVGFSRLSDDDLGLSPLGFPGLQPDWLRRRLLADFEVTAALGGLHVLSFHTQGLGSPESVPTLSRLAADFKARGAWVAGPAELVGWSRSRAGLELTADMTTPGRLGLTVRASAGAPGWPVPVQVHSPPATRAVLESGSDVCQLDPTPRAPVTRLLVRVRETARDYRCEVVFVR